MALSYRRTTLDGQPLHPTTQMVSFGYDPSLSEGTVKPPVFLTSTFAFRSAEEGAEFFEVDPGVGPGFRFQRFPAARTAADDRIDGFHYFGWSCSGTGILGASKKGDLACLPKNF